jgi:hypothetical protein
MNLKLLKENKKWFNVVFKTLVIGLKNLTAWNNKKRGNV